MGQRQGVPGHARPAAQEAYIQGGPDAPSPAMAVAPPDYDFKAQGRYFKLLVKGPGGSKMVGTGREPRPGDQGWRVRRVPWDGGSCVGEVRLRLCPIRRRTPIAWRRSCLCCGCSRAAA
jgi:hypothetical protein